MDPYPKTDLDPNPAKKPWIHGSGSEKLLCWPALAIYNTSQGGTCMCATQTKAKNSFFKKHIFLPDFFGQISLGPKIF